jgi:hypothetical protein
LVAIGAGVGCAVGAGNAGATGAGVGLGGAADPPQAATTTLATIVEPRRSAFERVSGPAIPILPGNRGATAMRDQAPTCPICTTQGVNGCDHIRTSLIGQMPCMHAKVPDTSRVEFVPATSLDTLLPACGWT